MGNIINNRKVTDVTKSLWENQDSAKNISSANRIETYRSRVYRIFNLFGAGKLRTVIVDTSGNATETVLCLKRTSKSRDKNVKSEEDKNYYENFINDLGERHLVTIRYSKDERKLYLYLTKDFPVVEKAEEAPAQGKE